MSTSPIFNPLGYQGVQSRNPPALWFRDRDPDNVTFKDFRNYTIGDWWQNTVTKNWFIFASQTAFSGVWEQVTPSTSNGIDSISVDVFTAPGTNPVLPNVSGDVFFTGGQVASGTTPNAVQIASLAANSLTVQIQRSTTSATPDVDLNGVSHFNSSHFSVDSDGFVSLSGGGQAIDSFTVPFGTSPVVPDVNGVINLPAGNGFAFTGGLNAMTGNMVSPFTGDFTFRSVTAGDTETLSVINTDNTAANVSGAALGVSVAGSTQIGDPYTFWAVGAARSYAMGIDTSDSQDFKITTDTAATVTPSTGTTLFSMDGTGVEADFFVADLSVQYSLAGQAVQLGLENLSSAAGSSARFVMTAQDGSGDTYMQFNPHFAVGSDFFQLGVSQADLFRLTYGPQGGTQQGDTLIQSTIAGVVALPQPASALYVGTTTPALTTVDIVAQKDQPGGQVEIETRNTSNTASSDALVGIVVGGSSAGDPYLTYNIATVTNWTHGIRNSDSDAFYLTSGASGLGLGTLIQKWTQAGEVTQPLQPSFFAFLSSGLSNVTGDGTSYLIPYNNEQYDRGSDWDGTSTFTAPVTGIYHFDLAVLASNIGAGHTAGYVTITRTALGTYYGSISSPAAIKTSGNIATFSLSADVFLNAGDTVTSELVVSNSTKTVGIDGSARGTFFNGRLCC